MLERIKACLPSLPPAEQRVGKLVLSDPRNFAKLPVSELADRAHVSKPTVVRFCRSMGYDGLSDFKLKLAGTVSEGVPFIHRSDELRVGHTGIGGFAIAEVVEYRHQHNGNNHPQDNVLQHIIHVHHSLNRIGTRVYLIV